MTYMEDIEIGIENRREVRFFLNRNVYKMLKHLPPRNIAWEKQKKIQSLMSFKFVSIICFLISCCDVVCVCVAETNVIETFPLKCLINCGTWSSRHLLVIGVVPYLIDTLVRCVHVPHTHDTFFHFDRFDNEWFAQLLKASFILHSLVWATLS